ncbi:MAG TPA: response regulator transcription factor [Terriglobales bacterium]|jgi:DNA-binding response OmpR family regulator|nr:response regulator transcription factor [Terriglobales bacterium]
MARSILVVDDERTLRETLAEGLEEEGFAVFQAADGREAVEAFRRHHPDLILLDLMLPELSGTEVCRIIRAESGVPILMLTAKSAEIDKVVGLELGADDYVTKPFSFRELLARVRALLRRAEAQAQATEPETIDLGAVKVDLAGRRLMRDGETLPVKPKAFDLLVFLLRNAGHVFTRDQLLEHVWGYDYAGETRTVDVHVHWLRAQIEADPADPVYLETVRGVGYVLRRRPD